MALVLTVHPQYPGEDTVLGRIRHPDGTYQTFRISLTPDGRPGRLRVMIDADLNIDFVRPVLLDRWAVPFEEWAEAAPGTTREDMEILKRELPPTDAEGTPFLTRAVVECETGLDSSLAPAYWQVVDTFQHLYRQAFHVQWLAELARLFAAGVGPWQIRAQLYGQLREHLEDPEPGETEAMLRAPWQYALRWIEQTLGLEPVGRPA